MFENWKESHNGSRPIVEGPVQLANLRAPRLPPSLSGVFSKDGASVHIVDDKCILTFLYCIVLYTLV